MERKKLRNDTERGCICIINTLFLEIYIVTNLVYRNELKNLIINKNK